MAYKIYANILNEKLKREAEEKLKERQFGFKKGTGTIDAIYILNYAVNKEIAKEKGKVFAFFANLSAGFDRVDRMEMAEMLKKTGIS